MKQSRVWIRALLGLTLVAACLAAAIAPALTMVQAAPPRASAPPGDIVISSFRFSSTAATKDEYVEIFNRSCSGTPVDLSGYVLRTSHQGNVSVLYTFPAGTTLGPAQYFLVQNPAYTGPADPGGTLPVNSGSPALFVDPNLDINDTAGTVGLFSSSAATLPVDAVGYDDTLGTYFEGTPLSPPANLDQGYFRKLFHDTVANPNKDEFVDSNENASDFAAQDLTATVTAACGLPTVTLSGNAGIAGASMTWTRMAELGGVTVAPVADAAGNYSVTVPANWSGMLTPSKSGYTFTPSFATFNNVMSNQTVPNFTATVAAQPTSGVVINEVGWYGTIGNTANDWIELYNGSGADINFSADPNHPWVLEAQDGSPSIELTGTIKKGGFYLLGHAATAALATSTPNSATATATSCSIFRNVPIDQYFTGDLEYLGETLFLVNPANAVVDYANRNGGSWPAGSTSLSRSMERHAANLPDQDTNWYTFFGTPTVKDCAGNFVYGTPGFANWASFVTATPSPVPTRYRTPTSPPPTPFGHMAINEFLPRAGYDWNLDGKVDVYDEFVELYNLGPVTANLSGWRIDVISPGGNSSYSLSGSLQTGERLLFYRLKTNVELPDMGGTVRLINNRGVIVDARGYGPVQAPDQSVCRIPDGLYWRFPCFPTPGLANSLTGTHPVPPPAIASQPPPCVMSDIIPAPFRQAECYPFGADVFNPAYWDDQAGFRTFPVPDVLNKWRAVVQ